MFGLRLIPPHRRLAAKLIGFFVGVATTFALAIVVADTETARIRSLARVITADVEPKLSLLVSMRSTMRQYEIQADDFFAACADPSCTPLGLDEHGERLHFLWSHYAALKAFPGERELRPSFDRELRRLDAAMTGALEPLRRGDMREGRARFAATEKLFDDLDTTVGRILEVNRSYARATTVEMDGCARRALVLSVALGLLGVAFAATAATLAVRAVRREERLLRRRAEDLDQFAGRVAHDIVNPLLVIDSALYAARHGADEGGRKALEVIQGALDYSRGLVRALLEFARSGASVPAAARHADLRATAQAVIEQLEPAARHDRVALELEPSVDGLVACSDGVLASVLANLVENGMKHMGASETRRVMVRAAPVGEAMLRIEIADTGPGIDPSVRERIFEPFVRGRRSRTPGYGLGLAIVKRLVDAHGGRVGFASYDARGSSFWVELPRVPEMPARSGFSCGDPSEARRPAHGATDENPGGVALG
jgi:signal transduction histidine kinase